MTGLSAGKILEPEAFDYYGLITDLKPVTVGFVYRDDSRTVGCSPDALVGDDGLLELKCKRTEVVLGLSDKDTLTDMPKENYVQVQGQIWVTRTGLVRLCKLLPWA